MNYQMLKTLLDSLVVNFKCPECQGSVKENNIELVGAAGTSVNLDISCPNCQKHTFVKAEVSQVNLGNIVDLKPENIEEFKHKLAEKLTHINLGQKDMHETQNIEAHINDEEILELRDVLKHEHIDVKDIL